MSESTYLRKFTVHSVNLVKFNSFVRLTQVHSQELLNTSVDL